MIEFVATRIKHNDLSSVALWRGPGLVAPLYCLEPGVKRLPHPGIPVGTYPLRLRAMGEKHAAYKSRYDADPKFGDGWHQGMIEICDVPGRTAIEWHVGNFIRDSLGCSLAGLNYGIGTDKNYEVSGSRAAYEKFYPVLRDAAKAGAQLKIMDEARP